MDPETANKDGLVPVRFCDGVDLVAVLHGTIVVVAAVYCVAPVIFCIAAAHNLVPVIACAFAAAVSVLPNISSVCIREILTSRAPPSPCWYGSV